MADDVLVDNGDNTDYTVSTDEGAGGHVQRVKLAYSADGSETHVDADANGLLVNLGANNDVTVTGTVTADDGGSTLSVDDGGSSLTVDGTVGVSGTVTVDSELTTADLDTGAGTDTRAVVGLVGSKSGGGALIPGDATAGLKVDLGADNDVTVTGTVAVTQSGTWDEVGINDSGNSITVDAPVGTPVNVRLSDGASNISTLPVSLASVPSHAVTNAGTFAVQESGSALTSLQKIDDPVLVDDAAFTPATSSVMMAGFEADESSTDSVDEGDAGAGRMTLDRKVIVNPQPHTAGGLSIFRSLDIDETEEDVKTSAGQVYGWFIANTATSTRFVKFYNATAANVTVGTTTPVMTLPIPGNSSDDVAAHVMGAHGIAFDTAICVAATTGVADNDTGAPGANDVIINVWYK